MRKKNVLMSAIAALAFAACSSDDVYSWNKIPGL